MGHPENQTLKPRPPRPYRALHCGRPLLALNHLIEIVLQSIADIILAPKLFYVRDRVPLPFLRPFLSGLMKGLPFAVVLLSTLEIGMLRGSSILIHAPKPNCFLSDHNSATESNLVKVWKQKPIAIEH